MSDSRLHARHTGSVSFEPDTEGVAFGPRSLGELVRDHGGEATESDRARVMRRLVSPENAARDDDLVVVTSIRGARAAVDARGVILCQREIAARCERAHWVHAHAMYVVAKLMAQPWRASRAPTASTPLRWVDPRAVVHPSATVRRGAVVLAGARVGPHSVVGEGAVIYGARAHRRTRGGRADRRHRPSRVRLGDGAER